MVHERSANENNLVFNEMLCFNEDEKLFNLILVYKILKYSYILTNRGVRLRISARLKQSGSNKKAALNI